MASWLTGWLYRRPVTIDNTSNPNMLTDYQVLVVVDTASLISAGKMKTDGGDIRFTDSDGTTLLPYWVEGPINANNTRIWVKVPQIPDNGTKTIYLYYGNSAAQSESSIANTFIREIDGAQPVQLALPLDEGSGTTAYDQSGNGRNATITGATWTSGKFGYALSFDGVDDYGRIPSFNVGSTQITMEVWAYPTSVGSYNTILSKPSSRNQWRDPYALWLCRLQNNGYPTIYISTGSSGQYDSLTATTTIPLNQWTHLVFVFNAPTLAIYINGSLNTSKTTTRTIGSVTADIGLGTRHPALSPADVWAGRLDEVRVYNRALTAAEISDLYNYYGYTTLQYPGGVLVRKRSDPEPTTTVGSEEVSLVIIRQRRMILMSI
jgi:hypothetical protein